MISGKEITDTIWERMMRVFYTRDVASVGVVFDHVSEPDFQGKPVTYIAVCQYVPNTVNGKCNLAVINGTGELPRITEPSDEINGVFIGYGGSGIEAMRPSEKVDDAFLPDIIRIVNECPVSKYFIDKHYRDMTFWLSGASLDRKWYPSIGELEKYDEKFSASVSDYMDIPDDIAAYMYFEPKVRELVELIHGCSDPTGKADASTVQKLLRRRLGLNEDDAWAVFDYALKLGLFVEVENVYAKATGRMIRPLPGKYDPT